MYLGRRPSEHSWLNWATQQQWGQPWVGKILFLDMQRSVIENIPDICFAPKFCENTWKYLEIPIMLGQSRIVINFPPVFLLPFCRVWYILIKTFPTLTKIWFCNLQASFMKTWMQFMINYVYAPTQWVGLILHDKVGTWKVNKEICLFDQRNWNEMRNRW